MKMLKKAASVALSRQRLSYLWQPAEVIMVDQVPETLINSISAESDLQQATMQFMEQPVKNGIQLAVDEINEAGGINGYQIEYSFEDDQSDAEKSVNAYNTLKDWGMQMLVGTVTSTPCVAVVEETHADNMFQFTPSATAVESIQYDNAFRMCFSDPDQGKASADYISENGIATKIAVIYNSSDTYSTGIRQKFEEEAESLGLDIVASEAFTADSKTDFSVQIQKAKDAGAETCIPSDLLSGSISYSCAGKQCRI